MSEETTISAGNTVQLTRDLRPWNDDSAILLAGSVGTVVAIGYGYAKVDFDLGLTTVTKAIPLAVLELVDRPVNLGQDWNLIAHIQHDPVGNDQILEYHIQARYYDPRPIKKRA